ncbi:transporter substrate-binding domain-containing protein [Paenibacillus mucilaginosus]|uniref:ABC-type glutamine/glutamate transporter, periplasmic binding protein n=1 Tax=Paenibacillus mucilaginosus (strain KNP414) TaxID=1036673 RepID=F8FB88_PAEMK|nr:transporter substrate-binding domain-containing protein [Paenibacillus mucilaginosus]AEI42055.1 ABC-type glutamine/glutamate transporter, periplasmic binding protein [Paenibacillus mucilaginosus KNP414]MCG7217425.1 transporter substrate-binding domain-containing protein [Paenibacillus mucilaginosus]WDM28940.1 transporter substrate-binding domain-containing protein [Paenibacillus mucilaginosus]
MKKGTRWLSAGLVIIMGLLAGCGGQGGGSAPASAPSTAAPASSKTEGSGYIQKIKDRGKLVVGVFTDKPPFGTVDEKGSPTGFENELARRFAKDLLGDESKIEFVTVEPASRIPYLQSDKVDLIVANMTVTEERKKAVDFTNPNLKVATQVLVKQDAGIRSLADLKGKKVIVTKGTTADIFLTKNRPDVELVKFDKNTESLQALKDGRGVAYAQDNIILFSWARKNPGFTVLPEKLEKEAPLAPAVKKGNTELRDWVNQELEKLGREKYLLELYNKYVKDELGPETNPNDIIVEGGKWE